MAFWKNLIVVSKLYGTFYIIPTIQVSYDTYYEGGLVYVDLEFTWLKWAVGFRLKKENI